VENNPVHPEQGTHEISFSKQVFIEADDFLETPIPSTSASIPGNEVRLKGAYLVTCTGCVKDETGRVTEITCDLRSQQPRRRPRRRPQGQGRDDPLGGREAAADAEVRLYDNLFTDPKIPTARTRTSWTS
jgi:glutaminyl-tRNA synthetase